MFNEYYMKLALREAEVAFSKNEIPVGAVILHAQKGVIASRHNLIRTNNDPIAHAEILAIQDACKKLSSRYLDECTLYSTLQPCPMCIHAIILSRIQKLIFGAMSCKEWGTDGINYGYGCLLNCIPEIYGEIMVTEATQLLQIFFASLRQRNTK